MFGLNKVTGRGRQTVDALKQVVENKLGVLSNVQSDSKSFSFPTASEVSFTHTHTFKLENSTGVFIKCACAAYEYGVSVSIKRDKTTLLEVNSGGAPLSFSCGFSIENGFIVPYYFDILETGREPVYFALTDGKGTFGDITVVVKYDGTEDTTTYVSNITANFN